MTTPSQITDTIVVANLRCDGCATTITKKLMEQDGVANVQVDIEQHTITVTHNDSINKAMYVEVLHSLGYPEATAENGLLLHLKSLQSCVIGKVSG